MLTCTVCEQHIAQLQFLDMAAMPSQSRHMQEHNECTICKDTCIAELPLKAKQKLLCGHEFHQSCLLQWQQLAEKNTCPLCRGLVKVIDGLELNTIHEITNGAQILMTIIKRNRNQIVVIMNGRDYLLTPLLSNLEIGQLPNTMMKVMAFELMQQAQQDSLRQQKLELQRLRKQRITHEQEAMHQNHELTELRKKAECERQKTRQLAQECERLRKLLPR